MYLIPKPRWNTGIAIVYRAGATTRVHRTLGTQPPAKRVRLNPQTAIRPIPSCKEAKTVNPASTPTTQASKALAVTTEMKQAFMERPQTLKKEADFQGTLNTDHKPTESRSSVSPEFLPDVYR